MSDAWRLKWVSIYPDLESELDPGVVLAPLKTAFKIGSVTDLKTFFTHFNSRNCFTGQNAQDYLTRLIGVLVKNAPDVESVVRLIAAFEQFFPTAPPLSGGAGETVQPPVTQPIPTAVLVTPEYDTIAGILSSLDLSSLIPKFVKGRVTASSIPGLSDNMLMDLEVPVGVLHRLRDQAKAAVAAPVTPAPPQGTVINVGSVNMSGQAAFSVMGPVSNSSTSTTTTNNVTNNNNTTVNNYFKQFDTEADGKIGVSLDEFLAKGGKASAALKAALEKAISAPDKLSIIEQALVQVTRRPALFVRNDTFEFPDTEDKEVQELYWKPKLVAKAEKIEANIKCVGRIADAKAAVHIGTGWIVKGLGGDRRLVLTNRHVAKELFDLETRKVLPNVDPIIDFKQEYNVQDKFVAKIESALYISKDTDVDAAVLLISAKGLPAGITWSKRPDKIPKKSELVVIGYPADDPRQSIVNEPAARQQIFKGVYNVKRLQPGVVNGLITGIIQHDASTLGGNSGSVVLDLEDDNVGAVGLHFGAEEISGVLRNLAVHTQLLKAPVAEAFQDTD